VDTEYTIDPEIVERAQSLFMRLEELAAEAVELMDDLRHDRQIELMDDLRHDRQSNVTYTEPPQWQS